MRTPAAAPKPPTAPQAPSAMLRSRPSVKVVVRIESAAGVIVAAPRPWSARATMSDVSSHASPQSSEPTEKMTTGHEHDAPPEDVRQTPAEQQEAAEDERVGADHPLQVLLREPEIRLNRRKRDVDDRDVEDDQELRDAEKRQANHFMRSDVTMRAPSARCSYVEACDTTACAFIMQVSLPFRKNRVYNRERREELQPVLPGRTCARPRRRALVAAHRARAPRARPAPLLRSPRRLGGCGTNILAARLKELERHGIVTRRRLPPPAASTVYELTEYGQELRPVMHVLAHWGARSLGPPTRDGTRARLARRGAADGVPSASDRLLGSSSASATRSPRSRTERYAKARSTAGRGRRM